MPTTILIMVDGFCPDAIGVAACPHLKTLRASGSSTLYASSIMPSITIPCHMTIFHSVPPTRHGITTNNWQPTARPLPGLVEQAKAANLHTAFFYNWEPLRNLSVLGSLDFSYFRNHMYTDMKGESVIVDAAVRYIANDEPDFVFFYFGTIDTIGHIHGWMSDEYLAQIEQVDGALGVLLQSDHGGHDRSHGTDTPEDMTIPWIVAGPGIRAGYEIQEPVCLLDTAPTLAKIMDFDPHPEWEGRCIDAIFDGR